MKLFLFLFCCSIFFGINAQQTDVVDFLKIEASVGFESIEEEKIGGQYLATFKVLQATDSIYLDAMDMVVKEVVSTDFKIKAGKEKIWLTGDFQKDNTYVARFSFEAYPKQTLYFTGDQVWTQGQGKYTSHWLPSIDDMNDKIEFDIQYIVPSNLVVIANGKLIEQQQFDDRSAWRFDMEQPMSSYLVAFAVGEFDSSTISSDSSIPIKLYYRPEDAAKTEPTYRYTKEIFDFLEKEIGVPYPWQNYKQVPVRDFLYAGMENTTATIFSEAFVVDSIGYNDRNFVNVNGHEMAHHWFGNLVTETEGEHHWLQEGFATYYAHLTEKEIFGTDYYYWLLYQSAEQLKALSEEGKGEALVNAKASSLTFYEKGAWALHVLKELIGEENFRKAVQNYLWKYAFYNVTTNDFLDEVRAVTTVNISDWEEDWLYQSAFKAEQALASLKQSPFMKQYFELAALRTVPIDKKLNAIAIALESNNDYLGQEAVYQLMDEPFENTESLYKLALDSPNLYIRQAVALSLNTVPETLRGSYEKLLTDNSYVTREAALMVLWNGYPAKRKEYLDTNKGVIGFQDKNIRMLWLALAYLTEDYMVSAKSILKEELQNYTSEEYSFEIRQKAFEYVNELRWYNETVIDNLVDATVHHNWRFRSFARNLLTEVIKNPGTQEAIISNMNSYSEKAQEYLKSNLKTK